MKLKTTELHRLTLDWAVTSIEEPDALKYGVADWREQRKTKVIHGAYVYRWSTVWQQGGPIIERERMEIRPVPNMQWVAIGEGSNGGVAYASTALEAAMRCYVMSMVGAVIDVPDELVEG